MRNRFLLFAIAAATIVASCKKDNETPPKIAFKTGASYVSEDMTVGRDTTITVGIIAAKASSKDVLLNFDVAKSYNGASLHSDTTATLSGTEEGDLSRDLSIHVRNEPGIEKYRFTIISKNGYKNSLLLTLTVK